MLNIVAIIGTTISPYLFFWQANQEVEEAIDKHRPRAIDSKEVDMAKARAADRRIIRLRQDTTAGMCFSNLIAFFIIATTASVGRTVSATSKPPSKPPKRCGRWPAILPSRRFAGIVGTGLLAVPVLAGSASYAIAEAAGWKTGLYKKLDQGIGFYGVITLATLLGLLVNFTPIAPFKMLYYTAVLNGVAAPPLMLLILLIGNNEGIMGGIATGGAEISWVG